MGYILKAIISATVFTVVLFMGALSLTAPAYASVTETITITPAYGVAPVGTVTYSGAGSGSFPMDGDPHSIDVEPDTPITFTVPADGAGSRYRFVGPGGVPSTTWTITTGSGGDTYTNTVYYQYPVSFGYTTNDGTPIVTDSLIVFGGVSPHLITYQQGGNPNYIDTSSDGTLTRTSDWVDAGSAVTYKSAAYLSFSEKYQIGISDYMTHTVIASVDESHTVADPLYYHQVLMTFQYHTNDDSVPHDSSDSPIAPYINFQGCGMNLVTQTSTSGSSAYCDVGSTYHYDAVFLYPPSDSERWVAGNLISGTVATPSAGTTLDQLYYHQYLLTLQYNIANEPAGSPVVTDIVGYTTSGAASTTTPAQDASATVWADSGTPVTYVSPITSGTESWIVTPTDTGLYTAVPSVGGSSTVNPSYTHRFPAQNSGAPMTVSMSELYGPTTPTVTPTVSPTATPGPAGNTPTATASPAATTSPVATPVQTASPMPTAEQPAGSGYWVWIAILGFAVVVIVGGAYILVFRK